MCTPLGQFNKYIDLHICVRQSKGCLPEDARPTDIIVYEHIFYHTQLLHTIILNYSLKTWQYIQC